MIKIEKFQDNKKPLITGELAPSWVDLPLLPSEPGGFIINCRRTPL